MGFTMWLFYQDYLCVTRKHDISDSYIIIVYIKILNGLCVSGD